MTSLFWIPATLLAAALQTARNATQRSLTEAVGVMGATQARFVFGLPFAVLFLGGTCLFLGSPPPSLNQAALLWSLAGSGAQILATALMLAAMRERSFAVTTACVKTEPAQVAVFAALALGDPLSPAKFAAVLLATAGVMVMTVKPGQKLTDGGLKPVLLGVVAGAFFGLAAVCFRGAILSLEGGGPVLRASTILAVSLAMQAALCVAYLLAVDRKALSGSLAPGSPRSPLASLGPRRRSSGSSALRSPRPPMSGRLRWSRCSWPRSPRASFSPSA